MPQPCREDATTAAARGGGFGDAPRGLGGAVQVDHFETNGLKELRFQDFETESAFNTRGQAVVFNLHLRLTMDITEGSGS